MAQFFHAILDHISFEELRMLLEEIEIGPYVFQFPPVSNPNRSGIQIIDARTVKRQQEGRMCRNDKLAATVSNHFLQHCNEGQLHFRGHAVLRLVQAIQGIVLQLCLEITQRSFAVALEAGLLPDVFSYELSSRHTFASGLELQMERLIIIKAAKRQSLAPFEL